ncbi:hypothetical protein ANCDUO_13891, partial [Ancylostoma duodenale]
MGRSTFPRTHRHCSNVYRRTITSHDPNDSSVRITPSTDRFHSKWFCYPTLRFCCTTNNLNLVQVTHITLAPTNTYGVRINGNITLPKRTTNIVPARIDYLPQPRCTTFLIEDNLRPMDDIYIVDRALVTPEEDGTCLINILNPSYKDIYLPDRMNIAHAYPACASEVQVHSIQTDIPTLFQPPRLQPMNEHCTINSHDGQFPMLQPIPSTIAPQSTPSCNFAYIPPEADWEKHVPQLPAVVNPNYDIADEADLSRAALNNVRKEQLRDIIRYHTKAFVGPDGHLGHYKGPIRHRIDLVDNAVIPTREIFRVPLDKRQEIERQISEMLEQGVIREPTSPFCAPIVLVKKREANTWRFTIDFRGLNAITKPQQTLNKHESRSTASEREALGLGFAVQKFPPYTDGAKCTAITDHAPLRALLHRKDLTVRLAKYQIILQEFEITTVYRPGKNNVLCDTLSRHLPDAENVVNSIIKCLQCDDLFDKIMKEQNQCPRIIKYKASFRKDQDLLELSEYILINDILYKLPTRLYHDPQLVLPETSSMKNDIIHWAHQSQMGTAHLGIRKTQSAVEKIAIWNRMTRDIAQFVKQCKQCQARKDPSAYRVYEPLHQFEVSTKPWQRVHSDVISPLPLTLDGNKYILVFVDPFSKYIVAEPLPHQKSNTTAQAFINRFVARFGLPETLVIDQGSNYMSDTFTTLLRNLHRSRV